MDEGKPKPILDYVITPHCSFEMGRRLILEDVVRSILRNPEQRLSVGVGRIVLQSRITIENKLYLIRVFVDTDRHPAQVVTAYLTTKISKYWRNEP